MGSLEESKGARADRSLSSLRISFSDRSVLSSSVVVGCVSDNVVVLGGEEAKTCHSDYCVLYMLGIVFGLVCYWL